MGVCVRIACVATDDVPTTDATAYLRSGASLWAGAGFERDGEPELHFPPATPVLLGGAERVLGDTILATGAVFLLFSSALMIPVAGIAHHLGGWRTAVAATWMAAVAPALTILPVNQGGGSEAPFALLSLCTIWLLLRMPRWGGPGRVAGSALAGGLVGLAYLTRPEGLLLVLVVVPVLVVSAWEAPDRRARRVVTSTSAFLVVLALVAAPYVAHLQARTDRWQLTAKAQDASMDAWRDVAERDRRGRDAVFYALDDTGLALRSDRSTLGELVREDPGGYAGIVAVNVRALLTESVLRWSVLPVVVTALAAVGAWRRRRWKSTWMVLAGIGVLLIPAMAFFVLPRYLIASAALALPLAAVGLMTTSRPARHVVAVATGVLLVAGLLGGLGAPDHLGDPREPVEHRLVGEWLAEQAEPDDRLMTRNQVTQHYAGLPIVPLPAASPPEVLRFARHHGVDWLVVDEYRLRYLRPQLDPLFEDGPWPGLRLVHEIEVQGRLTRVFRLDPPPDPEHVPPPPGDASFVADQRAGEAASGALRSGVDAAHAVGGPPAGGDVAHVEGLEQLEGALVAGARDPPAPVHLDVAVVVEGGAADQHPEGGLGHHVVQRPDPRRLVVGHEGDLRVRAAVAAQHRLGTHLVLQPGDDLVPTLVVVLAPAVGRHRVLGEHVLELVEGLLVEAAQVVGLDALDLLERQQALHVAHRHQSAAPPPSTASSRFLSIQPLIMVAKWAGL